MSLAAVSFRRSGPRQSLRFYRTSQIRQAHSTVNKPTNQISMDSLFGKLPPEHHFYNYTSGRYLYNEQIRRAERHLVFNVHALCQAAATALGKSVEDVVAFDKIAEGGSYRVFQTNLRDGTQLIARLPYPSVTRKDRAIASEVATIAFLRGCGIPIPKVYSWKSTPKNPVGSEYIIMEKAQGKPLRETWHSMTVENRLHIVSKIVLLEKKMFDLSLPAYGSIYFQASLPAGTPTVAILGKGEKGSDDFCLGPSADHLWRHAKRDGLGVNGGPWRDTKQLLLAVGQRELAWLQKFGRPRFPSTPGYQDLYGDVKSNPAVHVKALNEYMAMCPGIVPDSQGLNRPTLRHPDLSPSNIFVSDDGSITALIDWEDTTTLPLFLQAWIPDDFQNYGDEESENVRAPKLPDNFASLSSEEREHEQELYRKRQLHYFYLGATRQSNRRHFDALFFDPEARRARLYHKAKAPWQGDNISLRAQLVRTVQHWPRIHSKEAVHCPVKYTEKEIKDCLALEADKRELDDAMETLRANVGIQMDGWVSSQDYAAAKQRARDLKAELISTAETEEERKEIQMNWAFQDHAEIE